MTDVSSDLTQLDKAESEMWQQTVGLQCKECAESVPGAVSSMCVYLQCVLTSPLRGMQCLHHNMTSLCM